MTESVQLALDLGAESGRAVVGTFDGGRLRLRELRRFPNRPVRLPEGLYWDALGLYAEVCRGLGDAGAEGSGLRSIGIDGWGCDFGLIAADGALVGNPLHHRDGRGSPAMEAALARVGADEIYELTGIQFLPFNTLYQLVALEASPLLAAAANVLLVPDLLGFWLCGARVAELTNASTTQLLDVRSACWASELLARLGIRRSLFPELVAPGEVIGSLLPHVAEATRLPAATRVVAVASHDTASAVVAVPFAPGQTAAYISSGTWSLVGVELEAAVVGPRARAANLTNERGASGRIRLLKNVMGLWLLQECRRAWAAGGTPPTYAELVGLARAAPEGGPLFDPDLPALFPPGDMPARIRALWAPADGDGSPGRGVIVRAILESLACKYRFVLEEIERVTGSRIEVVHVIGGGAENDLLCELTAEVTMRPVLAGPVEAAALGNIAVQLSAFGELGSLAETRALVRASTTVLTYEPTAGGERWEELYDRFLRASGLGEVAGSAAR